MKKKRRFFFGASIPRALAETGLVGGGALLLLINSHTQTDGRTLGQAIFFLMPLVALWYAVRLAVPTQRRIPGHVLYELGAALGLSPLVTGIWLSAIRFLGLWTVVDQTFFGPTGTVLIILSASLFFLVFRVGVRLWLLWESLRRRRMVWMLTHIQLQLVLVGIVFVALAGTIGLVFSTSRTFFDLDTWVFTILPFLSIAVMGTLAGIVIIIPPALLIAWLSARRTTRRLEDLTAATTSLRRGDYRAQISVEGEDEVAQLQRDFNAMAAALEQAMSDLQAERDKVTALLEARRQLVAGVSHELRTPLATMRGYLESLQERIEREVTEASGDKDTSETLHHDLNVIESELSRLQTLIDDLFTLSRAEVDGLTLNPGPVDVAALVQQRVDAVAPLAWSRDRVQVIAEIRPELPPALADAGRVDQILVNLLRNGLRHTPPGGIIAVSAQAAAGGVTVRVCDTGEGIPAEELDHIWERFYRGTEARARDAHGAGLGLALVKELAEAMGGHVTVESEVGAGSCFAVWLPITASP
jgi:signal transduction histidine kinase